MNSIKEILKQIELHDSTLESIIINGNGSANLILDIDEVWNKELNQNIKGIFLESIYEISDFKIDRFNVIESIEIEDFDNYDKQFIVNCEDNPNETILISIKFVIGGTLDILCSDSAKLIYS